MAVESEPPIPVDVNALREDVKSKYREVAIDPHGKYHFHTGRYLAKHLGYDDEFVASLPDVAVESFAGVANPFSLQTLAKGEHVVDVGSGGGFDSFVAVHQVGASGKIVGVDMTEEMLAKSRSTASALGLSNVEFREGLAEHLPVEDNWADVVISNGVINLCADKRAVFSEIWRVLRPGGRLQFADIANGKPVPEGRSKTLTCGRLELPVVCRVQPGRKCCPRSVSSTFGLVHRSTPSRVPTASRRLVCSKCMDTHSSPESLP